MFKFESQTPQGIRRQREKNIPENMTHLVWYPSKSPNLPKGYTLASSSPWALIPWQVNYPGLETLVIQTPWGLLLVVVKLFELGKIKNICNHWSVPQVCLNDEYRLVCKGPMCFTQFCLFSAFFTYPTFVDYHIYSNFTSLQIGLIIQVCWEGKPDMASGIAHEHLPDVKVPEVEGEAKDDLCEVPGELHTSSG